MKNLNQCFLFILIISTLAACSTPTPTKPQAAPIKNPSVVITQAKTSDQHTHEHDESVSDVGLQTHFEAWLQTHHTAEQEVVRYQAYLRSKLGNHVPPMSQLLTTARSWQACGHEPYQVPPAHLWDKIVPTLQLYQDLKSRGVLPDNTQIRSVYRNPELNQCAGGAAMSKHLTNGAIDIWVPDFEIQSQALYDLQNRLCQYWLDHGENHNFGLGLYATGAIHLDTQGFRKWGAQFSETNSICRHVLPKNKL
ncbi:D-Ala-D-Ala carboxypeptidase family metallohydrolase [Moraxella catarrhalis]|uniref:Peptidase M15A C-terminal domain-containing protein n=1 Tax=Moraxella catarrhalis TaxID=480 RepID=A0A198UJJ9_MORCA|nr:D-Ala-D-Ala carboxypeptidase family metallohydrolase [Moraxella catarrhalis]OAU95412.1 hypothetical protein AO384_1603 [Moraxella catarrhalis]OAU98207.1 hypothetical protein AO383_0663 [Moraxella catarrhalis]